MDTLKSKGIKAFTWNFLGKISTQGIGFIVTIFLARLLEPSEFGLIAMVMVIVGIASVFSDIGLGAALIQRKKLLPVHYSSVFYFNIFIGLILTLITYFSAEWIGGFYNNEELIPIAQVMSLTFTINAFSSLQSTKLRKDLNYGALTKASLIASLISGGVSISLAYHGAGVWSLVAQTISLGIVYNILIWSVSKWTPPFLFSLKALMQLWGFGFRMFLSGLLDAIFSRLDFLIIGKLFMPVTLGYFQRAKSLNSMVIQLSSGSLMAVLFPILSKIQNDLPRFQKIIIKMLGIICFIVFLLLGGLYLIAEEFIVLLFGDKWLPSVSFFQILVFSGFGYPVSTLLVSVLSSRGNSKAFLRTEMYKKIIYGLNLYFGFFWGVEGYLYGFIVATSLAVMINIYAASREICLPVFWFVEPIIDQAIIVVVAVMSTLYLMTVLDVESELLFIVKSLFFTTIYILMSWLFKTNSYRSFSEEIIPIVKQIF